MIEKINWKSFKRELPPMFQPSYRNAYRANAYRSMPILLQLNYHWVEETFVVVGMIRKLFGAWEAVSVPSGESIPLSALVAWAEVPDGLDSDDDDYIYDSDDIHITGDSLEKLFNESIGEQQGNG